jgi:hypothetical protein
MLPGTRGVLHTLPFLIPQYRPAVLLALIAMAFELLRGNNRHNPRRAGSGQLTDAHSGKACRSRTAISYSTSGTGRGSSTPKRNAPDEVVYPWSSSLSCAKTEPLCGR